MAIWTVDFVAAVTVEADDEDAAIAAAVEKLEDQDAVLELEFFDFSAWEE